MKTNTQIRTVSISLLVVFITAFILMMITGIAFAQIDAGVSVDASTQSRTNNSEAEMRAEADAGMTMCTMDAYQCPNGEWVGRTGASCEFVCGGETVVQPSGPQSDSYVEPIEIDYDGSQEGSAGAFVMIPPIDGDTGMREVRLMGIEISDSSIGSDGFGKVSISVDAVAVRGWDVETKSAVRTQVASEGNVSINNTNSLGLSIALEAIDNEPITSIMVEDGVVTVSYKTELSVFGFIPVPTTASVVVSSSGAVSTEYPWWSFLARRSANDATYADIATSVSARIATGE